MVLDFLPAVFLGALVFAARLAQWYLYLGRRLKGMLLSNADTWIFLIDAKKMREHNFSLSSRVREDSVEADKYYPPLFFYLLAVVPEKFVKPMVKYVPALADAFVALILSVSMMLITNNWMLAALAAGVYLSSPMIFQQTFCFCIRPLSILLVSLVYIFSLNFSWSNFLIISILVAFILLLHKFATQVVLFVSLAFLFIGRFDFLLSVAVGFLISMAISKGYYLKVLKAHLAHLKSSYLKQFIHGQGSGPLKKTAALAIYCPWVIFFAVSIYTLAGNIFSASLIYSFVWVITSVLFAVLTNFWKLKIIGEGWRYLGYIAFPLAFWAGYAVEHSPNLIWAYTLFAFAGVTIGYYYVSRLFKRHQKYLISEADTETFKQISSIEGRTIAALPREFTYPISYFSGKDYAARLELDFEERAAEFADIIVINKECADAPLYEGLSKRGYTAKFEKEKWIVYTR
jgi:hypothetical protein